MNIENKIITALKAADGYISGEALSRTLNITRAGVWKHIETLRLMGYKILAVPRHGYRLTESPDRLIPAEVQQGLLTRTLGKHIHYFDSIPSTMNEAFRLGSEGAPDGTVIIAETQTKGRGRMGRGWASPKNKGIYFSVILRPKCAPSQAARMTLVSAVAVSEAVERVTGIRPLIKWPNDLLLGGRKLCGILTEMRAETDRVEFMVAGIGINVNNGPHQLLPEAISLKQVLGRQVPRVALFQEILKSLEERYLQVQQDGFKDAFAAWRARSATLGQEVRFLERDHMVKAEALDIDEDGALLVRLSDGRMVKRVAGDIAHG
jgi:BirA family transcriptional regulator, biotin operon repressor / biotin---[acetyl-CoA-carboxylase] ligase